MFKSLVRAFLIVGGLIGIFAVQCSLPVSKLPVSQGSYGLPRVVHCSGLGGFFIDLESYRKLPLSEFYGGNAVGTAADDKLFVADADGLEIYQMEISETKRSRLSMRLKLVREERDLLLVRSSRASDELLVVKKQELPDRRLYLYNLSSYKLIETSIINPGPAFMPTGKTSNTGSLTAVIGSMLGEKKEEQTLYIFDLREPKQVKQRLAGVISASWDATGRYLAVVCNTGPDIDEDRIPDGPSRVWVLDMKDPKNPKWHYIKNCADYRRVAMDSSGTMLAFTRHENYKPEVVGCLSEEDLWKWYKRVKKRKTYVSVVDLKGDRIADWFIGEGIDIFDMQLVAKRYLFFLKFAIPKPYSITQWSKLVQLDLKTGKSKVLAEEVNKCVLIWGAGPR